MISVWTENNKLYTHKPNLKNWEFNAKLLNDEKFNALRKDREELLDLGTLLVMPEDDHLLVLGGNQRNQVDGLLGREKEPIELIDFSQLDDGRWYVVTNITQNEGGQWVGETRTDLRSFATKFAAMKTYSYKHNSQYAGYNPDELSTDMANPELSEIDWSTVFANVGEPKSLQDYADLVAPEALEELGNQEAESTVPSEQTPEEVEEPKAESISKAQEFEERLVECPECHSQFDPKKYPASTSSGDELDEASIS